MNAINLHTKYYFQNHLHCNKLSICLITNIIYNDDNINNTLVETSNAYIYVSHFALLRTTVFAQQKSFHQIRQCYALRVLKYDLETEADEIGH